MKIRFIERKFTPESLAIIAQCTAVVDRYNDQGYKLTTRQLYYQMIAAESLPDSWRDPVTRSKNNERSYKKLSSLISDARLAGIIDWEMIEDRGRSTSQPGHWDNPRQLLEAAARAFARDKWRDQPNYIEVMVEKQALEGVLQPVCSRLGISFTSNKGYSSSSTMFDVGQRLKYQFITRTARNGLLSAGAWDSRLPMREILEDDSLSDRVLSVSGESSIQKLPLCRLTEDAVEAGWPRIGIIYFGDHDPSGIDMTRDVGERLSLFADLIPIEVHRVALNMDQVEELNPPENPAKETDSRANNYIAKFGNSSWELDAVSPEALATMVEEKILEFRDETIWAKSVKAEDKDRRAAMKAIASLPK